MLASREIYTAEDLIAFCSTLPTYGTVSRVSEGNKGDFYFIQLPDEWQRESTFLAEAAKTLYQLSQASNLSDAV